MTDKITLYFSKLICRNQFTCHFFEFFKCCCNDIKNFFIIGADSNRENAVVCVGVVSRTNVICGTHFFPNLLKEARTHSPAQNSRKNIEYISIFIKNIFRTHAHHKMRLVCIFVLEKYLGTFLGFFYRKLLLLLPFSYSCEFLLHIFNNLLLVKPPC